MRNLSPNPQSRFWPLFAQSYRGRTLWPFAISIPILCGFIAYTWKTQAPLENLNWLPENIGAVLLLGNMIYATGLFCRASWFTLKAMTTHFQIIKAAVNDVQNGNRPIQHEKSEGIEPKARWRMLMPIGLIFSHVFVLMLFCLPSSLLINAPYLSP